jgi:hypothetical protein
MHTTFSEFLSIRVPDGRRSLGSVRVPRSSLNNGRAKLSGMPLIIILIVLLIVFGGGGYYMGPGIGYYGGGGLSLLLALLIVYLLFGRGRSRL